jgi:glycosyltransferase involved in cell wall biosynthesis
MSTLSKLRIAVVAPPWFEIPPLGYGGIEAVCELLVEGLIKQGHEVTLIAAGSDETSGTFLRTFAAPPSERLGQSGPEVLHAALSARHLVDLDVDVVHDHSFAGPLAARGRSIPTVITAHGPVTGEMGDYYQALNDVTHLVAISDAQQRIAPHLEWTATVHNGIPVAEYPFQSKKEDYAVFLGRMSPEKAPHLAIDACRDAGVKLVIAAKCTEAEEFAYFEAEIRPRLDIDVHYAGEVKGLKKKQLLASARCLVFPIQWDEPFGMVMVESLACGTPVVALNRGSVPEIVTDGVSGFICESEDDLPESIKRSDVLSPLDCREAAEGFDAERMVAGYVDVYRRLLEPDSQG